MKSNKKINVQVLLEEDLKEEFSEKLAKNGFFNIPDFYRFITVQFMQNKFTPSISTVEQNVIIEGKELDSFTQGINDLANQKYKGFQDSNEAADYLDSI